MHLTRVVVREVMQGEVLVEPLDQGCGRCKEPGGCGGVKVSCSTPRTFRARDDLGAVAGELVEVAIGSGRLARLVTFTYVFPLVGLILGALFASGATGYMSVVSGVSGLLLGYLLGRHAIKLQKLRLPQVITRCGMYLEGSQ